MNKILCISLVSLSVFAETFSESHIKKLKSLKEIKPIDLVHEHIGCPENSKCSKASAKLKLKWNKAIKSQNIKRINYFIKKYGHPTVFLAKENDTKSLDPIIFSSRCEFHRKHNIVRAELFLKQKPKNSNLVFNEIIYEKTKLTIPYLSRVIGFKNNRALIIFSDNDSLYTMSYSNKLRSKAVDLKESELTKLLEKKENIQCENSFKKDSFYMSNECYKVWDLTRKKLVSVEQKWSCP